MKKLPVLYIFGGLPASGKTTLARHFATVIGAAYIRIESIEEAILANNELVGPEGYEAGYTMAGDNLENGVSVIADSVNPIDITRVAWRKIALDRGMKYQEIEVICSNKIEHRKRLEDRSTQTSTIRSLTWEDVENRHYEAWNSFYVFDTTGESPEKSKERLVRIILESGHGI